jgi:hypothetical protein
VQLYSPRYPNLLVSVNCFLFLPGPSFHIVDDNSGYAEFTSTKIQLLFVSPRTLNITDVVIHVSMYPPEYDPNTYVYKLEDETIVNKLSGDDIRK